MVQRGPNFRLLLSRIGMLAWLLLAAAPFILPARADVPHPKRKDQYKHQVELLEESWRTAELSGDADAMDKLLSDDYVGITMTGQVVTKMQQLDRMRSRSLVLTKISLDDVKVKLIGTTAIVTSLADVEGTDEGQPMHGMFRYTRVYTR
jgi:ketosteroid isomerase-like protein